MIVSMAAVPLKKYLPSFCVKKEEFRDRPQYGMKLHGLADGVGAVRQDKRRGPRVALSGCLHIGFLGTIVLWRGPLSAHDDASL
jgi:hypothetical protein